MRQKLAEVTSDFVGKHHSLTLRQTPRWAQSLILLLMVFAGSAIAASAIIKIDEVITVSGALRPIGGTRKILAPVTATIDSVNVKEGQVVESGQVLAIYDTRDAQIKINSLKEQLIFTKKSLKQNLTLRNTEKQTIERALRFSQDITSRYKILAQQGASSEINQLNQEKQLADISSQLIRIDQQTEDMILQYNQKIRLLEFEISQLQLLIDNSVIKSSTEGIVFDLMASPRQIVTLGQSLLTIIPRKAAKAEVFVSNRDIGFVKMNQAAQVKVDAYPFTKFGDIDAKVTHIGADALEPDTNYSYYRFPVTLTLSSPVLKSQGRDLPLKPGMSVGANLKLREKRLISLLTDMFSRNVEGLKSLRD